MIQKIEKSISIKVPITTVWRALTDLTEMKQWMAEPEMELVIITNWRAGEPFIIHGKHNGEFTNSGCVIEFQPEKRLAYDYLSSISHLPNILENRTRIEFTLTESENETVLKQTISNFPTASILKHIDFYWNGTLTILKDFVEKKHESF